MTLHSWKLRLVASGALLGMVSAFAGPLQRSDVMSDPAWVVHVDCDALRETTIGKQLLGELSKPEAEKKLAAFKAVFNVDPRKDLHGVSIYSATKAEPDGVVIGYADFDAARLVTLVQANKGYASTTHGAHTIHNWIDEKKKAVDGEKPRTYGAIYKDKVLVIGQKESRVAEALEVLDHSKANLASSAAFGPLGTASPGTIVLGAARKLDLPGNDPGAAVFKQAKMIWLNLREVQGKAELKLSLDAENAEVAKQMVDVCRGLVAVLGMQTENADAVKLAKGISIEQDAASVSAKLVLPVADVVQMIKDKTEKAGDN